MKLLTGWIMDPCVHILAIVILFIYVVMGSGPDVPSRAGESVLCQNCQRTHGEFESCTASPAPTWTTLRLASQ